jgi:hypothetical protein
MKSPSDDAEKFSIAGQLCKFGEGNESNLSGSQPSLDVVLRTAGTTAEPTFRERNYRLTLACSAELCAASASLAEIAAVSAAVPQLGASLPLPQARGR